MKRDIKMFMAGMGAAIMYEQIKNGNLKKMWRNMKNKELKAIDELENMMR